MLLTKLNNIIGLLILNYNKYDSNFSKCWLKHFSPSNFIDGFGVIFVIWQNCIGSDPRKHKLLFRYAIAKLAHSPCKFPPRAK